MNSASFKLRPRNLRSEHFCPCVKLCEDKMSKKWIQREYIARYSRSPSEVTVCGNLVAIIFDCNSVFLIDEDVVVRTATPFLTNIPSQQVAAWRKSPPATSYRPTLSITASQIDLHSRALSNSPMPRFGMVFPSGTVRPTGSTMLQRYSLNITRFIRYGFVLTFL